MPTHPANKYHLKDLHQEIDLLDRKLDWATRFEKFELEKDRAAAVKKLETKRKQLINAAAGLITQGVEYDPKDLPRSQKNVETTNAGQR